MEPMIILLAILPSVISGIILGKFQSWQKRDAHMEELRQKESFLIMKNIDAIGCLSEQTARCIRGEKPNGELTKALKYRKEQQHELEDHLMQVNAKLKK